MKAVSRPSACALPMTSQGTVPFLSYSRATGRISRSANSCAVFWRSRCSSVRSNSTIVCPPPLSGTMSPAIFNRSIDMTSVCACSLVAATARVGARAFLQESVVWAVGTLDGRPFDEDAPPAKDPILASALDGERIAREAGSSQGFPTLALRCGGFYSADGWHTRILADSIAKGRPVLVGRQSPLWSLIHTDDAASAFVTAAEAPKPGVWHVVD